MRKLVLTLGLFGALAWLPACEEKCGGRSLPYFDIRGFSVVPVVRPDTTLNLETYNTTMVDSASVVEARAFGIWLRANVLHYAEAKTAPAPFPGVAYACDPVMDGEKGSQETISDIRITSNSDFDASHPAGSSLNEFFAVSGYNNYAWYDSISRFAQPIAHFLSQQPKARENLFLWLRQRPESTLEHRFTIRYEQTNAEQYVLTTPRITFQ